MKCARELLRDMPVMDKGEKAAEASGFDTGRKQDWVGRVSGGNAVLRKFQPGRRDFLKPKSPVRGVPHFTRVDLRGYPLSCSVTCWERPVWLHCIQGQQLEQ